MNLLTSAVECLAATLEQGVALYGTYSSVDGGEYPMRGTPVEREYEVIDDDGTLTTVKSTDWIFRASDLAAAAQSSEPARPQPGDVWQPADDATDQEQQDYQAVFEAMLLGNRPCFEPHDSAGVLIVVHMKKVHRGG